MKHYCRYCLHCVGQDTTIGVCEKKNEVIKKTSIRNACPDFCFCEVDAFYYNRSENPEDARYKPRAKKERMGWASIVVVKIDQGGNDELRITLIDVDSHNFPNLPLMKLSAWHKQQGDTVEWYDPLFHSMSEPFDKAYMSKVFGFTPDYPYYVNAKEIHKGGSGYCIQLEGEKEVYDTEKDAMLPPEIETIYPDYEIYYDKIPEVKNTAYGFLTRGCPRGCKFCHVGCKEGRKSYKVANLDTFWREQKNIVLLDPNITACKDWKGLFQQLIDSKAWIDFSHDDERKDEHDKENEN